MGNAFCGECGAARTPADRFCRACGHAYDAAPPPPTPAPPPTFDQPQLQQPQFQQPQFQQPVAPVRRRRRGLVSALALVVVLAGAGVAATVVLTGEDDAEPGDRTGPTLSVAESGSLDGAATLLSEPADEWTLDFDEVLADGSIYFTFEGDQMLFPLGDTVVLELVTYDESDMPDGPGVLAGVDSATGDVLWTRDTGLGAECFAVEARSAVACVDEEDAGSVLLDARTGAELASYDRMIGDLLETPGALYVLSYPTGATSDETLEVEVARLSPEDLTVTWDGLATADMESEDGFDGSAWLALGGGDLILRHGPFTWEIDQETGTIGPAQRLSTEEGFGVDWGPDDETLIQDEYGNTLLSATGEAWSGTSYPAVVDGRVGIGSTLYDVATGAPLWSREDLVNDDGTGYDLTGWRWTEDPDLLVAGDLSDLTEVSLLDAEDGSTIWSASEGFWPDDATFTTDAVAFATRDGEVVVRPTSADGVAWSRPLDAIVDTGAARPGYWVRHSERTLLVASTQGMIGYTGFTDTPAAAVADLVGDGSDETTDVDGGTDYATDCGSEPIFTPESAVDAYGGVTVTYTVTAYCGGGQWLHASSVGVAISAGGATYASGSFDWSQGPVWVPEDGTSLTLTYPYETTYATAGEIQQAIDEEAADGDPANGDVIHVDCIPLPGSSSGEVPASPDDGADPASAVAADGPGQDAAAVEESALEALQRIAAADDPAVSGDLEDWWMPQLSSKVEGTTDDGIVYTYEDILSEHLRLRARYPGARLVNSADWGSFLVAGYWVTVVGETSARPGPALAWCRDQYLDAGHCYAKRLRRDGPSEGNTRLQH